MPTSSCSSIDGYRNHLTYILQHKQTLLEFYGERKWSRMRWKTHINKQKAYDEICSRITNNDKRTVIAFGSGGFSSTSRGHASGPVKQLLWELRKRCRVRIVDEYRTSKICSLCNERFHERQKFWSVRLCKNIGCLVNIIFFFLFEIRYIYIFLNTYIIFIFIDLLESRC
jgi:hypothetical protein